MRWYIHQSFHMVRLNSGNFSKFSLCSDTIFLTYSYERTHREVQKNVEFFSNILEYSWFFRLFRCFSFKSFLSRELQSRGRHHKIRHKIPHRTVYVVSLRDIERKRYHVFYWFYGGWNRVGFIKIKYSYPKKYWKISRQLN